MIMYNQKRAAARPRRAGMAHERTQRNMALKVIVESLEGGNRFEQVIEESGERALFEERNKRPEMTFEDWTRPLNLEVRKDSDPVEEMRGEHFVADFFEVFFESDEFPEWVYELKDGYRVIVKRD